ncbi:hypothetical protein, partial [Sphingomonas sp.]|uniref:hypothetical protein n=1 Tax=Sphingomonas sp. TaxID=28214 RepID=UPI002B695997
HVAYLNDPIRWRSRDPELFDALKTIVDSGRRNVAALERANLLSDATYFNDPIPTIGPSVERRSGRLAWFRAAVDRVSDAEIVFLDPDNGLETANFNPGRSKAGKSVALSELEGLRRPRRTLIVYHHQTRMSGGHLLELAHWGKRLASMGFSVDALRASAFSARAFFLLDASNDLRDSARALSREWGDRLTWHPDLG